MFSDPRGVSWMYIRRFSTTSRVHRVSNTKRVPLRGARESPSASSVHAVTLKPWQLRWNILRNVDAWCDSPDTIDVLKSLGISAKTAPWLLRSFKESARIELKTEKRLPPSWNTAVFNAVFQDDIDKAAHRVLLHRFIAHAAQVPNPHRETAARLIELTNMQRPAEWFPRARSIKRTIHLHVGPTNSGKTYNALRALAAARAGVYAGPLRLLAHEVWERLNNGSITAPAKNTGVDILDDASVSSPELSRGRACNLLTGEENRVVDPLAGLLSCTVEMLPRNVFFDVAVIDEIQMIADPLRGGAWTYAVLGVCAKELHLCGEDTVVDLIQRLAVDTGDEVVVHRYERLTPLVVSESIDGDFSKIQKGDCVVAFSRNKIFEAKKKIEEATGLQCAVAYGRLPPEVRSEQAQHFNDPESGRNVMVASDAIGMGLNLKIKRVIFTSLLKFDGKDIVHLSTSQTKQIAGRAGRFGLHKDGSIGEVTTMWSHDLWRLRNAMKSRNPAIVRAYLELPDEKLEPLYNALPPGGGFRGINLALEHLALPSTNYVPLLRGRDDHGATFVDKKMGSGFFTESNTFLKAPAQWRELKALEIMNDYVDTYHANIQVDLEPILESRGYITALRAAQDLNATLWSGDASETISNPESPAPDSKLLLPSDSPDLTQFASMPKYGVRKLEREQSDALQTLETMHKSLVLYLWLSQRMPLAFSDRDRAQSLKDEVERTIDGLLSGTRGKSDIQAARVSLEAPKQRGFYWEYAAASQGTGLMSPREAGVRWHAPPSSSRP